MTGKPCRAWVVYWSVHGDVGVGGFINDVLFLFGQSSARLHLPDASYYVILHWVSSIKLYMFWGYSINL